MSLTTLTRLDFLRPGFDVDLFRLGKGITSNLRWFISEKKQS